MQHERIRHSIGPHTIGEVRVVLHRGGDAPPMVEVFKVNRVSNDGHDRDLSLANDDGFANGWVSLR